MTVQGGRRSALRGRAGNRRGGLGDWEEAEVSEPSSCNTTKASAGVGCTVRGTQVGRGELRRGGEPGPSQAGWKESTRSRGSGEGTEGPKKRGKGRKDTTTGLAHGATGGGPTRCVL